MAAFFRYFLNHKNNGITDLVNIHYFGGSSLKRVW